MYTFLPVQQLAGYVKHIEVKMRPNATEIAMLFHLLKMLMN